MKKLVFLVPFVLNEEHFNPGETKKFTHTYKGTNSKNAHYLPEDMVQAMVKNGAVEIIDPNSGFEVRHNAVAAFYNDLETRNDQYAKGLISDSELMIAIISAATNALANLNIADVNKQIEQDKLAQKVEKIVADARAVRSIVAEGGGAS
jgi:PBP1b-binding outer membrane lipoprotein LpoB